jgi:hypothetical protein
MAEKEKEKKNPMAEAANWNARCITEEKAPHVWNEAWGQMFAGALPHDYGERIEFLEQELKNCPPVKRPPKYGLGDAFPRMGADRYNKAGFDTQGTMFTPEELDKTWADMQRRKREGDL